MSTDIRDQICEQIEAVIYPLLRQTPDAVVFAAALPPRPEPRTVLDPESDEPAASLGSSLGRDLDDADVAMLIASVRAQVRHWVHHHCEMRGRDHENVERLAAAFEKAMAGE